jgi:hypothetical protein
MTERYWSTEAQRWIYPSELPPLPAASDEAYPAGWKWYAEAQMREYGEQCYEAGLIAGGALGYTADQMLEYGKACAEAAGSQKDGGTLFIRDDKRNYAAMKEPT